MKILTDRVSSDDDIGISMLFEDVCTIELEAIEVKMGGSSDEKLGVAVGSTEKDKDGSELLSGNCVVEDDTIDVSGISKSLVKSGVKMKEVSSGKRMEEVGCGARVEAVGLKEDRPEVGKIDVLVTSRTLELEPAVNEGIVGSGVMARELDCLKETLGERINVVISGVKL